MKIYLISLLEDSDRREKIKLIFPYFYEKMEVVNACNGKMMYSNEYFNYLSESYIYQNRIITPSELGCTLSHIQALNLFLCSESSHSLILEDDIIGSDEHIIHIMKIKDKLPKNSILICGGQEGFNYWKYIVGKKKDFGVYQLSKFSIKFIYRTCCYLVDKSSASYLHLYHTQKVNVVDNWSSILKNSDINFFYCNILSHPEDLSSSNIEEERSKFFHNKNFFKRILDQGFFWKIFNRFRNDFYLLLLILNGYRQIHKDSKK